MITIEAPIKSSALCAHCSLPVPAGLVDPDAAEQFCCNGCRGARELICSLGLHGFYRVRDLDHREGRAADTRGREFDELDHAAFMDQNTDVLADGSRRTSMLACSIHCAACVWLIEKLPAIMPGVLESRVDLRRKTIDLRWDPNRIALSRVARRLDALGYSPLPCKGNSRHEAERRHNRGMMIRLGVAGALAGNVMLISFALYGGVFHGISGVYASLFRWTALVLAMISLAWPGSVFFRGAIAAWRARSIHMDMPVALGLLAGALSGAYNTMMGAGEVYFDSVTSLVFLLLLGRYLQHRQQQHAANSLELLGSVTPASAWRVDVDGVAVSVPIEALGIGDIVEVRAGEIVPADGEITSGVTTLDRSVLTGESDPVLAGVGEQAAAGVVNLSSVIRLRVLATGHETRMGRLMAMVGDASAQRAPIVRLADRIAKRFILIVLTLSAVTMIAWLWINPSRAVANTAALLIVTCPCALGLATPLALAASIGRAARRGILIKGGDALESLAHGRGGTIVLDKTGTVTRGSIELVGWIGDTDIRHLVSAAEQCCTHPIARALVRALGPSDDSVESCQYTLGGGLVATVDGRSLVVGSPEFVQGLTGPLSSEIAEHIGHATQDSLTPVAIGVDGSLRALALLGDPLRDDAIPMIDFLRDDGWRPVLLSGDHPGVARSVGHRLGLSERDAIGGATPEGKASFIQACDARPVVMVGDGVNDAAAMRSADVGVAVHGGAEASMHAADIYLSRPGLAPLRELLIGSRRTIRTIKVCMGVSAAYNCICAALAVAGMVTPLLAAVLMPLSSLTVVTIAYRSRSFTGGPTHGVESWN